MPVHDPLTANCVLLSIFTSTSALAQSTLGELFDSGGKKLSKEDVVAALSGATISETTTNRATFHIKYYADGTYSGNRPAYMGAIEYGARGVFGTWTVDESGNVCSTTKQWGSNNVNCRYFYRIGGQYYISNSDSDRSAKVYPRTLEK